MVRQAWLEPGITRSAFRLPVAGVPVAEINVHVLTYGGGHSKAHRLPSAACVTSDQHGPYLQCIAQVQAPRPVKRKAQHPPRASKHNLLKSLLLQASVCCQCNLVDCAICRGYPQLAWELSLIRQRWHLSGCDSGRAVDEMLRAGDHINKQPVGVCSCQRDRDVVRSRVGDGWQRLEWSNWVCGVRHVQGNPQKVCTAGTALAVAWAWQQIPDAAVERCCG